MPAAVSVVAHVFARRRPVPVTAVLIGAAVATLAGCCKYQVNSFAPDRFDLCPGEATILHWDVDGPATLRAERTEADWDEQVVPSAGMRSFAETSSTKFTLTALKQNPAEGNFKVVTVFVATNGPRGGIVKCATGLCTASLNPDAASVRVARLSQPTMTVGGRVEAVRICVTHEGMAKTCVDPGQSASVDVPFGGAWTLEALAPPDATPPQKLALSFEFNCAPR